METEIECVRMGAPYDDPAFEALCREMSIWGTAQAALCAAFWRRAGMHQRLSGPEIAQTLDGISSYCGEWETALARHCIV